MERIEWTSATSHIMQSHIITITASDWQPNMQQSHGLHLTRNILNNNDDEQAMLSISLK